MASPDMEQLLKLSLTISQEISNKKSELTKIIVSTESPSEKLNNLTFYLLKMRGNNPGQELETFKNETTKILCSDRGMEMLTMMNILLKPAVEFDELINSIGETLRSDILTDDNKVNTIARLLV